MEFDLSTRPLLEVSILRASVVKNFCPIPAVLGRHNRRVHLGEADLLPAAGRCHLCAGADIRVVGRLQRLPDVDLIACSTCGVVSASRMPTVASLERYYASYHGAVQGWTTSDPARLSRHIVRTIRQRPTFRALQARIMDFGGGDGSIALFVAERLMDAGICAAAHVTVVDPHGRARARPGRVALDWQPTLDALDGRERFDLIVASGVLEHVPNANAVLANLLRRLAAGGLFYARTPFMAPWHRLSASMHGPAVIPYPGHLHDMGRTYWDRVLRVLRVDDEFRLVASRVACVEAACWSAQGHIACLAHLFKAPSRLPWLRDHYDLVGGWEAWIARA